MVSNLLCFAYKHNESIHEFYRALKYWETISLFMGFFVGDFLPFSCSAKREIFLWEIFSLFLVPFWVGDFLPFSSQKK